jgi:hypothetical protein
VKHVVRREEITTAFTGWALARGCLSSTTKFILKGLVDLIQCFSRRSALFASGGRQGELASRFAMTILALSAAAAVGFDAFKASG